MSPLDLGARLAEKTTNSRTLAAVVLAAGKGKRWKSSAPKVLHPLCGRPILWHVLQTALVAKPTKIVIVVGHGADDVRAAVRSWGIRPAPVFVEQAKQLGTGHAVMAAQKAVGRAAEVLVANGDFDPIRPEDLRALLRTHRRTNSAASIITATMDPGGYGRVIREGSKLIAVRELADASPDEREIREGATNWVIFRRADLFKALPKVDRKNRQREVYLNRVYPILMAAGERVSAVMGDTGGMIGPNSRRDLAQVARFLRSRINDAHMDAGVTLVDPDTTYIDAGVTIGRDTVVHPLTFLAGDTSIGSGCQIGPSTRLVDTHVADGAAVSFSVAEGAVIGRGADVGPFARLRPGTELAAGVHVGSYVEIKAATIGAGTKVPHLSYVGDATIGERTNIGAATVTVNYDGYRKHRTIVGDDARIGSDTMLVAPVTVGDGAVTGAGSVITEDVPAGALALERSPQVIVEGYRERKDRRPGRKR